MTLGVLQSGRAHGDLRGGAQGGGQAARDTARRQVELWDAAGVARRGHGTRIVVLTLAFVAVAVTVTVTVTVAAVVAVTVIAPPGASTHRHGGEEE